MSKYLEINLSVDDDYFSQVNNKFFPLSACMATSFIMALKAEKIPVIEAGSPLVMNWPIFIYPAGLQPEDFLMALLRSPWGYEMRDKIAWAKRDNIEPNMVHAVLSEAINRIVGVKVTEFVTEATVWDLFHELENGHPAVVSGSFTDTGHAVAVVGAVHTPGGEIKEIIVDDPYGNYFKGYSDKKGNNIHFPVDKFTQLWAGWYHRFNRFGI